MNHVALYTTNVLLLTLLQSYKTALVFMMFENTSSKCAWFNGCAFHWSHVSTFWPTTWIFRIEV